MRFVCALQVVLICAISGQAAEQAGSSAKASDPDRAVRLVVGPKTMTFEGKETNWQDLAGLIEAVENREAVVLQLGVSTDEITLARLKDARTRAQELVRRFGLKSVQYVGVQPLGGPAKAVLREVVDVSTDPDAEFQTIQQALDAVAQGGLIRVAPGRYKGRVRIRKPVRIQGAGWDKTTIAGLKWEAPSPDVLSKFQERAQAATNDEERRKIQAEAGLFLQLLRDRLTQPVVRIAGADGVSLQGLKFTLPGTPRKGGGLPGISVLDISGSRVEMHQFAIVGSPGDGMRVYESSKLDVRDCLVAAVWNTGIAVAGKSGDTTNATITDCDIRNCYHRCLTIGTSSKPSVVRRCRISGSAWHGIRYGGNPIVEENLIFAHARSGIYASGSTRATVRNNLFWRNEMDGISCWFENRDTIEGNTFVENLREALAVLGGSEPIVRRNIFCESPIGVVVGPVNSRAATAEPTGVRNLENNLFWKTEKDLQIRTRDAKDKEPSEQVVDAQQEGKGNAESDPGFTDRQRKDFSLADGSAARKQKIGVAEPLTFDSPWPLQPEERAIIPSEETRDWNHWKRPE